MHYIDAGVAGVEKRPRALRYICFPSFCRCRNAWVPQNNKHLVMSGNHDEGREDCRDREPMLDGVLHDGVLLNVWTTVSHGLHV